MDRVRGRPAITLRISPFCCSSWQSLCLLHCLASHPTAGQVSPPLPLPSFSLSLSLSPCLSLYRSICLSVCLWVLLYSIISHPLHPLHCHHTRTNTDTYARIHAHSHRQRHTLRHTDRHTMAGTLPVFPESRLMVAGEAAAGRPGIGGHE